MALGKPLYLETTSLEKIYANLEIQEP